MSDTLPCPFCGSEKIESDIGLFTGHFYCEDCFAIGPDSEKYSSKSMIQESAKIAWNTRTQPKGNKNV